MSQTALKTSDLSRSQAETLRKSQNGVIIEQYFQSHLLYKDSVALNKKEHGTGDKIKLLRMLIVCNKHITLWEIVLVKFSPRNQNKVYSMYRGNKETTSTSV